MLQRAPGALVLLVEDSEDLRETLEAFLVSRGYRVVAREDVQGALEAARAERPDLVVTDIFLGNANGLDLITRIRSDLARPPPIVACSGMPDVAREALARGAAVFLVKPLVPDTLERTLAALLADQVPSRAVVEEHAKRSLALRARHVEAAREAVARLEPQRETLVRLAERDARWLRAFLGFGHVVIAIIRGERLAVVASTDPHAFPRGSDIEHNLPLCRHILETGSTFVVPDLASLLPRPAGVEVAPRFVAGFCVANSNVPIGVVCLIDDQPRRLDPSDFALLEELSAHFSDLVSGDKRPVRDARLMRRPVIETVLRTEFDRAARLGLTIHLFAFSSRTAPPELLAERSLVAELGAGRFVMIITRSSSDRSPADLVAAVQGVTALPGFVGGEVFSIEATAVPRLDQDYVLRLVERRIDDQAAAGGPPHVHRVVVHEEALETTP